MANFMDFVMMDDATTKAATFLKVAQAVVSFKVDMEDDPLTNQRMRDALSDLFQKARSEIKETIKQRNGVIKTLSQNAKKQKVKTKDGFMKKGDLLVKQAQDDIESILDDFKKEAGAELDAFIKAEKAKEAKLQELEADRSVWGHVKWASSLVWPGVNVGKDLIEAGNDLAEATALGAAGVVKALKALKTLNEAFDNLKELYEKIRNRYATLETAKSNCDDLRRKLRAQKKVSTSDLDKLEKSVKTYEEKLLGPELDAKTLSKKISVTINELSKTRLEPADKSNLEDTLDLCLKEIIKLSKAITKNQAELKAIKIKAGSLRQNMARSEGWIEWALNKAADAVGKDNWEMLKELYESFDDANSTNELIEKWHEDSLGTLSKIGRAIDTIKEIEKTEAKLEKVAEAYQ